MERPKRKRISFAQPGIPVINQIQPAVFKTAAVRFNVSKSKRIERAPVLDRDLDNDLILVTGFFDRDHFCGKRGHLKATLHTAWSGVSKDYSFAPRTSRMIGHEMATAQARPIPDNAPMGPFRKLLPGIAFVLPIAELSRFQVTL
jgi:hypothetical protein